VNFASPHYDRQSLIESDLDRREAERVFRRDLLRAETAIKEGARRRRQEMVAVTGRTSLHLVHDAEVIRQHAEHTEHCGWCNPIVCSEAYPRCLSEMGCTTGGAPTVPTRRNRRPARRSRTAKVWRALVAWLLSPRAW
jgi:hypothetical protein